MSISIAVIYANFGPYHIARLRALAQIMPDIVGIEISNNQKLYPWRSDKQSIGSECRTLFPETPFELISTHNQCKAIKQVLSELKPKVVVVSGYSEPVMSTAAAWARKHRALDILLSVSTYLDHRRVWWKELLKSRLAKRYSAVAATGRRAGEYVQKLGIPESRIFEIGNVVDNAYFENVHKIILKNQSEERSRRNLPLNYFITVARYSPEKNYPTLMEAFKSYRRRGGEWELVIVGAGPLGKDIFELVRIHRIPCVHFAGWQQYQELPVYYSLASCFILASISEPRGLVVNEAMACGLPILISRRCGCLPELCQSGINGYDFAPDDTEQIVKLMLKLSSSEVNIRAMGNASRQIISHFTPQT